MPPELGDRRGRWRRAPAARSSTSICSGSARRPMRRDLGGEAAVGPDVAQPQRHVGARAGQRQRDRPAEAARRAGDERHLSGQIEARKLGHPPPRTLW